MTLQRRLVAVMAVMLVIGLIVADFVTYASVKSFLYGRADATLSQDESLAFNYLRYSATHGLPVKTDSLSRRIGSDAYVLLLNSKHQVVMRRPSGPASSPDPAPVLTSHIPVQHVPFVDHGVDTGRYAGTFRPVPDAVILGSTNDPDGRYRAIAVGVPQGTLVTATSLNPTNDTLSSLRRIEMLASLAVLLTLCVLTAVFVRRGLRPLREMAGTADAIASGDLTRRVPVAQTASRDEVGQLGTALNKMLTQIESAFSEKSASEERLRQFVADASHELRTPLTSIRGYSELLGKGGFSDEQSRVKALKRIEEEAARMGGLVEDLLLLAELDRGRPLRLEPVDLHRVCADAVDDSVAVAQSHQLTLMPGGPVVVTGDGERLAQVAHNLVRNALAHTPPGTKVAVSTRAQAGMGVIDVTDDGPGIPPEEAARVFDRFYRADKSRSGAGTGLGLAIVHAIAEALGGSAEVRSGPGGGASVVVRIPLAASHEAARLPTAPPVRSGQVH